MNGLPYYPRYPRDFFDGTNGLSFELKGAYSMLIDLIYMSGGQLYDEPRFIAGHLNCSVRAWNGYRAALIKMGKIAVNDGIISNFRADKELIIQRSFQDKQRENGSKSNKNKGLAKAVAEPKVSHTDTDTDSSVDTSVSTAATAPIDPVKVMFDGGVSLLTSAGIASAKARTLLGKWRKDHGAEAVIAAIGRAKREGAIDPVAFIEGCFRFTAKSERPADGEIREIGGVRKVFSAFDGWRVIHA